MSKDKITHFSFSGDLSSLLYLASSTALTFPPVPNEKCTYFPKDPITIAEYVPQKTRLILIVPKSTPTSAFMYDTYKGDQCEEYKAETSIQAIAVVGLHIVLKTQNGIIIYHVDNDGAPKKLSSFIGNERALAVSRVLSDEGDSEKSSHFIVAFPGEAKGTISITSCPTTVAKTVFPDEKEPNCMVSHTIDAHDSNVSLLAISEDGTLVASVSEKGTCIRVFKVGPSEPQKIGRSNVYKDFYRGYKHSAIAAMRISPDNEILAVLSTKGTCHLYGLTDKIANYWKPTCPNSISSYCNISCGPMDTGEIRFSPDSKVIHIACSNGKILKYELKVDNSKHIVATQLASDLIETLYLY